MTPWYIVYKELAIRLLRLMHHQRSAKDPGKSLYYIGRHSPRIWKFHTWLRDFRDTANLRLDPLHVFACFNDLNMPDNLRIERLNDWYNLLGPKLPDTGIDFSGCPAVFASKLLRQRKKEDQDGIWTVFKDVMDKEQDAMTPQVYEKATKWYEIDFASFSVFLYWICHRNFIPLDKNTHRLLQMADLADSRLKGFEDYHKLIRFRDSDRYLEIAKTAYEEYDDTKKLLAYAHKLGDAYKLPVEKKRQRTTDSDFRLVGFRILKGTLKKYSKILELNKPYSFYSKFSIQKDGTVLLSPLSDVRLYATNRLNINISAIVGRNGSGKSTITELLYLIIYNISCQMADPYKGFQTVKGINIELYYLGNTMYRLAVKNGEVKVYSYSKYDGGYNNARLLPANEFKPHNFFYTLAVNYSHYGLNELQAGKWVTGLFTKNDGYQVPITITPYRRAGNIDINRENSYILSRLLANLAEYAERGKDNLRILTEDGRKAKYIRFSLNPVSLGEIAEAKKKWSPGGHKKILDEVYRHYHLKRKPVGKALQDTVRDYIYQVLMTMPHRYAMYRGFLAGEGIINIKKYLEQIDADESHAAYRFRQAVNFLKYPKLFTIPQKKFISLHELSLRIDGVRKKAGEGKETKLIGFIPASFYSADIKLNDGSDFRDLSSGEKQRIFAVSSLVYHLSNISSVVNPLLNNYSSVNIVFDEIELYFHPDMQRTFISYLLKYLERVELANIYELNFCFVTHSPFILSDIPSENILFLKKKGDKKEKEVALKTFGANIHELLMDGFFMEQTLGGFALQQVQDILHFYERVVANNNFARTGDATKKGKLIQEEQLKNTEELKKEYAAKKNRFYFVRDSLGEAYISNMVRNHIREIEASLGEKTFIEGQIKKLKDEIKRLERTQPAPRGGQ